MVSGDEDLNVSDMAVLEDVKSNEFFKLKIKTVAPQKVGHFSTGFMLIDAQGNHFGDKVVLDIIVEDDSSDAALLASMMDNVDMSMRHDEINFHNVEPSDKTRVSMMHHKVPPAQAKNNAHALASPSFADPMMGT